MSLFLLISLLGACDSGTESLTGTDFNPTNSFSGAAVVVAPSDADVPVGETFQFEAEVLDENGKQMEDVDLIWTSSDPDVATVNDEGVAEGLLDGSVQITAGVKGGPNNSVELEVKSNGNRTLTVTPSEAQVQVSDSVQFEAELTNNGGNPVDGAEITWSSSDSAIATIDADGLAIGMSDGSVGITATADDVQETAQLTVAAEEETSPEPAAIDVTPADAGVSVGSTVQFDATVLDQDGNQMDSVEVTWSSADPAIATVDTSGLAEGVADGSTTISATADNGVSGEAALSVASTSTSSTTITVEEPELPRDTVAVALPSVSRTIRVTSEAELQAAFDDVRPGDEIVLSRDRVWGQITLPDHGGDWAILRGEGDLPPSGTRITPGHDVTLVQHGSSGGIINASNVEGWYVYGLKAETTGDITDGLVVQNSSRIVFDRVWVWAPGDAGSLVIRRGVRLNGEDVALVNSRVEGIIRSGQQSQGVGVWDGGGPFRIENNFIEALNQNFLAGGASPSSLEKNPSDGVIRRNHFYKRPAWSGETGTIFMMEWKAGERWLVEGNVVENDYFNYTVAVKAPTEVQGVAGQRTGDITLRKNRYIGDLGGAGGYTLNRKASRAHTVDAGTFLLEDEWWDPRSSRAIRLHHAPDHVTIRRVTIPATHSSLELIGELDAGSDARLGVDDYKARAGSYGIWLASSSDNFKDYYPEHQIQDYWQYWGDDGKNQCYRNAGVPGTLDADQQDGLHCVEFESDIPSDVGADEAAVEAIINGVRDDFLP